MDTAIIVVWSATLIVALILTLVILKLVFLIVRTERDILRLADTTLKASKGISLNTASIAQLQSTRGVAGKILTFAEVIDSCSASIEQKLIAVGSTLSGRRP